MSFFSHKFLGISFTKMTKLQVLSIHSYTALIEIWWDVGHSLSWSHVCNEDPSLDPFSILAMSETHFSVVYKRGFTHTENPSSGSLFLSYPILYLLKVLPINIKVWSNSHNFCPSHKKVCQQAVVLIYLLLCSRMCTFL